MKKFFTLPECATHVVTCPNVSEETTKSVEGSTHIDTCPNYRSETTKLVESSKHVATCHNNSTTRLRHSEAGKYKDSSQTLRIPPAEESHNICNHASHTTTYTNLEAPYHDSLPDTNLTTQRLNVLASSKPAFTLAEVLITLGVIGVVAAITMPVLIQKHREKVTVTRLKAAYSIISQAFVYALENDGTPDTWGMGYMIDPQSHITMANKFVPYLKLSENCIGKGNDYTKEHCKSTNYDIKDYASVVLSNGTGISFRNLIPDCSWNYITVKDVCGMISVDINGMKKPNEGGYDMFSFYLTKNKIVPMGIKGAWISFKNNCDPTGVNAHPNYGKMSACTAWVLYNENLDYLHCRDLDWDGKTKCH